MPTAWQCTSGVIIYKVRKCVIANMFKEIFPPIETALELEPEELAPFVLKHLKQMGGGLSKHNYTLGTDTETVEYAGGNLEEFKERLMEAWVWLEREMFIAPKPGQIDWSFITRRGEQVLEEENFTAYAKESLLDSKTLDPILARKVKPLFVRGDYDIAIFQALKIVEVRVRKAGGYPKSDIGVNLMRKAFHPKTGKLTNKEAEEGEKEAMMHLFSAAIGLFKNPTSHRDVDGIIPEFTADAIRFANLLLRMVGDKSES